MNIRRQTAVHPKVMYLSPGIFPRQISQREATLLVDST